MPKQKSKLPQKTYYPYENSMRKETVDMLKEAWNDLPADFTFGERTLFIELAERLVNIAEKPDSKLN